MRNTLFTILELLLGSVVLAGVVNLHANQIDPPLGLTIGTGIGALSALALLTWLRNRTLREQPATEQPPPESGRPVLHLAAPPLPESGGRFDELTRLSSALRPGSTAAITGVTGVGSLGETELAKPAALRLSTLRTLVLEALDGGKVNWDVPRDTLDTHTRLGRKATDLRAQAAKEAQIASCVDLNVQNGRLESDLAQGTQSMGGIQ